MRSFSRRSPVVALLVIALSGACSGKDDNGGSAPKPGAPPTSAPGAFAFAVSGTEVQAMAPQAPAFPADVSAAVKASLDTWLVSAVVGPLRTGKPSSGLDAVFTEPALAKISAPGPERAAMLEEGPPLHGKVRQVRATAKLTALSAPGGETALVTAQIDVSHTVRSGGADVDVVRGGELVLVPDRGNWRIDAFDVVTKRDTKAKK